MEDEEFARARLEASLGLHRAKIETLRQLEDRLDARISRLSELSLAAKKLIDSMMVNPFQLEKVELPKMETTTPVVDTTGAESLPGPDDGPKGSKSPGGYKRSVSWVSEPLHEEVTLNNKDAPKIPVHGHWVPVDVLERRASFQGESAQKLGGRQVDLEVENLGSVPCILVEPMGKLINNEFVSTGMAIILQGDLQKHVKGMDEWAQVLKRTKLLDAGVSIAIPMLSLEVDENDLSDVVHAVMKFCSSDLCLLCGKGPGAKRAIEVAAKVGDGAIAAASILFAPSSPAPVCRFLGPVMLVWAQDDKESSFENASGWAEALAVRDATPSTVAVLRDPTQGGHDLARMLRKDEACATDVLSFVAAALLMCELRRLDPKSEVQKNRLLRLFEELPLYLTHQFARQRLKETQSFEGTHVDDLAIALVSHLLEEVESAVEIATSLSEWINGDMPSLASASE